MRVTVRLFAMLRERAGAGEIELELPEGARVSDALESLGDVGSSRVDLQACKLEYSIVSPK